MPITSTQRLRQLREAHRAHLASLERWKIAGGWFIFATLVFVCSAPYLTPVVALPLIGVCLFASLICRFFHSRKERQADALHQAITDLELAESSYDYMREHGLQADMRLSFDAELVQPEVDVTPLLSQEILPEDEMGNTALTDYLQSFTFDSEEHYQANRQALWAKLNKLAALAEDNPSIARLLQTPNQPAQEALQQYAQVGMPSNTPLMLMVKLGDKRAVDILLPYYDAASILHQTPRGNTLLHIAIITGQADVALAIIERAKSLGVLSVLLALENAAGKSPADILEALVYVGGKASLFRSLLDFTDTQLGGEEINKALVSQNKRLFEARNGIVSHLNGQVGHTLPLDKPKDVNINLMAYFTGDFPSASQATTNPQTQFQLQP